LAFALLFRRNLGGEPDKDSGHHRTRNLHAMIRRKLRAEILGRDHMTRSYLPDRGVNLRAGWNDHPSFAVAFHHARWNRNYPRFRQFVQLLPPRLLHAASSG